MLYYAQRCLKAQHDERGFIKPCGTHIESEDTRMTIRQDAQKIIDEAIKSAMPGEAVRRALQSIGQLSNGGRVLLVAAGKAAYEMALAAMDALGGVVSDGVVITKYGHARGKIPGLRIFEAGHPVPDANSFAATKEALALVQGLTERDTVLFLLSGGGSALFEAPLVEPGELSDITRRLLCGGADIGEMNTVRKRLSAVKGGRFALACAPARVYSVILSDVLGDRPDLIASGPACPDPTTCSQALAILEKYALPLSAAARALFDRETPKTLDNVKTLVTGGVRQLCEAAQKTCRELGYAPVFLTDSLSCEAREAGAFLAAVARAHQDEKQSVAYLAGGETVVHVTGKGLGGRNQELALAAAEGIAGLKDTCVFSFGSDGTDGPTDAAGGYVDGDTKAALALKGADIAAYLADNDAYHCLALADSLIITGPTGTNVNDLSAVLIRR